MRRLTTLALIVALLAACGFSYYAGTRHLIALPETTAAAATCVTFPETGKQVCARFLEYWQENGGLAQQGYPLTNVFPEVSSVDGKTYQVQYFERAIFEAHPENQHPYDVLLTLVGREKFLAKYPNGDPSGSQPSPSPRPFALYTAADVAAAFQAAGLTVGNLQDGQRGPNEPWPATHSEWKVFGTATIPAELRGGQILTYSTPEALQAMMVYLASLPGSLQAYAYAYANVVVYLHPNVPLAGANQYKAALQAMR